MVSWPPQLVMEGERRRVDLAVRYGKVAIICRIVLDWMQRIEADLPVRISLPQG